ncbi:hypothetical protein WA026_004093 [Henosepilachna vigintioctopunctata]|uniref:C2H2-type domain-containing protein n=1 Tax=Henosepilachna vigintioctopunctata TaxID=420089 RepID=A0AAW1U8J2_9CUCU
MESSIICPVCTLFLRPGITLRNHLSTHPKQKVIDALVKLAESETQPGDCCSEEVCPTSSNQPYSSLTNSAWNIEGSSQVPTPFQGNHVFIYQQSMSTSQTNSLNPLTQQYIIPAVLNPQMMPYVYQQQQFIMSSGSCIPQMRLMPFEMTNPSTMGISSSPSVCSTKTVMETIENNENENNEEILDSEYHSAEQTKVDENEVQKKEEIKSNSETGENLNEKAYDEEQTEEGSVRIDDVQSESRWNTSSSSEELNKACQTPSAPSSSQQYENFTKKGEYYYFNNESENAVNYSSNVQLESIYEQQDPIYTSANILQSTEHLDFVDVDGVQVIIGDFANNSIISRVDSFDNGTEGNVLMSIGENILETSQKVNFNTAPDVEESVSRSSEHVNIRTDERMPPRGELSGQESLGGTSDINWNRLHYNEGSSGTSYNLLGEEVWDDGSDADCPQNEEEHEMPSVVDYTPPPLNFKCSQCDEAFSCLQDRKQHVSKKHTDVGKTNNPKLNVIGNQIGKRKVKKLIVKLKSDSEKKYDTVFTNKIKIENSEQQNIPETRVEDVRIEENVSTDSRTVCAVCNAVLPHAKALKEHKMEIHQIPNNFRFKCTTCNNNFPNEYRFTEHLKVHPLECKLCGKLFYKRQNIQLHTKRHLGIKPYKCDMCEKSFVTKQKLQEHRNIHTGNAPIKCNLCDESFRRHSNLVQHRNRHHFKMKKKVKDYVCHCGEYFHSRKKLAWHKETHDSKPKACTKCNEKFIHLASLTRHMRKAHNERYLPTEERSMENVECPICKGVFLKSSLEVHIRTHSGARPFSCLICNKDFTTRWNLKLHKWTHASRVSKPFKCDLCNGAFVRESDYTSHMNSHKSIKPYTCNYCGAKFIRKYNCQRHVKEHENAKTYNCSVCSKSFHRSYYLKDHMRVHSGVRPFSCHVCGKTSTTKSNHNKHIQIHHAREPVSTEN